MVIASTGGRNNGFQSQWSSFRPAPIKALRIRRARNVPGLPGASGGPARMEEGLVVHVRHLPVHFMVLAIPRLNHFRLNADDVTYAYLPSGGPAIPT